MGNLTDEFKNNKPTWIWRSACITLIGILAFLGSWVFNEVSAMPKDYVSKEDHQTIEKRQDDDIRALEKKIDEGFKETQRIILDLHKGG